MVKAIGREVATRPGGRVARGRRVRVGVGQDRGAHALHIAACVRAALAACPGL